MNPSLCLSVYNYVARIILIRPTPKCFEAIKTTPWMDWKLMAIIAITVVSTLLVVIVLGLCYLKCRGAEAPKAPENTPKPKPRVGIPLTPRVVKK